MKVLRGDKPRPMLLPQEARGRRSRLIASGASFSRRPTSDPLKSFAADVCVRRSVTAPVQERGAVADLSQRVKLRLTGADRIRYLNGQVTANVFAPYTRSRHFPHASPPRRESFRRTYSCMLLSDAVIVDAGCHFARVPAARDSSVTSSPTMWSWKTSPRTRRHFQRSCRESSAGSGATRRRFGQRRRWILPGARRPCGGSLASALTQTHALADDVLLETLRIEAGIPRWGAELSEDTLPPEAGLDRTHIDYHKGCYIGQEVISRLKSVGHVNRRLVQIHRRRPRAAAGRDATFLGGRCGSRSRSRDQCGVEFCLGKANRAWLSQARIRPRALIVSTLRTSPDPDAPSVVQEPSLLS